MKTHRFHTTLEIPVLWEKLLGIPDFEVLADCPAKSVGVNATLPPAVRLHQEQHNWPYPLRDDDRMVAFREGGFIVGLKLRSGSKNYWVTPFVQLPNGQILESTEDAVAIADEATVTAPDGIEYRWQQKLV